VEDHRGLVLGEHLAHARGVLAVGQHGRRAHEVPLLLELAPDLEERVLGVVDQHQAARPHPGDLAAELRADRAARPGDEHGASAQVGTHPIDLDSHGIASQHVLHAYLAHLPHQVQAAGEQLERGRQRANRDAALAAGGDHLLPQRSRRRGDRDDHLLRLHAVQDARQAARRPEHLDARDPHALLARVVVHEADRSTPQLGVPPQLKRDLLAAVAGAHDQHLVRRALENRAARGALHYGAHGEARAAHEDEREQEVERDHAARRVVTPDREEE
jgi:hypothetical protein